eukprot:6172079-Pyramimonas_sp.AAC.2
MQICGSTQHIRACPPLQSPHALQPSYYGFDFATPKYGQPKHPCDSHTRKNTKPANNSPKQERTRRTCSPWRTTPSWSSLERAYSLIVVPMLRTGTRGETGQYFYERGDTRRYLYPSTMSISV